jgi:electron transport complex protein RnfC
VPATMVKLIRHRRFAEAVGYGLTECMECGSCAYICPAKIDLVHYLRHGKQALAKMAQLPKART